MSAHLRAARCPWSVAVLAALLSALAGCSLFAPTGTVTGTVVQALSPATPIAGVRITVPGTTFWTDSAADGTFSVDAPVGTVTVRLEKGGWFFADFDVTVPSRAATVSPSELVVGYPQITSGEYRFILTWSTAPADLDAYLVLPLTAVPWSDTVWSGNSPADDGSAAFELGSSTGSGPESIRVLSTNPGTCAFSVRNVSGTPDLGASAALVRVYDNTGLLHTVSIAAASGSAAEPWWKVFTFDEATSTFTILNQMSATGP
jgi:hypothetical protein